jgi:C4-dicarboxylate transporter
MPSDPTRLALLRRWAVLLDSAFAVPGVPVRFGLDAIVGLVPGVGDLATPAFTALLIATGVRMGVPPVVLVRMAMNAGIDALIGIVPLAGDLFDVAWKANLRNLDLLERHAVPGARATRGDVWFVAAGVLLIALVAALALIPIAIVVYVLTHLD